ncbi:MAG: alpha/beta fold hydrolase, partial [Cyclobacteriaceae bacterium]
MPVIHNNSYRAPMLLRGKHFETIFPALFRRVKEMPESKRKSISLSDGDRLTYDHYEGGNDRVAILSHGLEGNSKKAYIQGLAKILFANGYDVIAWNFRSCDGEMNNTIRFYHSGATDDLEEVVKLASDNYRSLFLAGFSLGANLTLKFAGEPKAAIYTNISKIAAICAPLNLHTGSINIGKRSNILYARRFLKSLKKKVLLKDRKLPGKIDTTKLREVKTLFDFDDHYTAPLHGFTDAADYYKQCSSIYYVRNIKVPALIVNALNDPMLPQETYDTEAFNKLDLVTLELTGSGGHCGFPGADKNGYYWSE